MKFLILATLFVSVSSTSPVKEVDRREGISYSTTVIHKDPKFPDQQAQSSIDFNLETSNSSSYSSANRYPTHELPTDQYYQYTTQKNPQNYQKRNRGYSNYHHTSPPSQVYHHTSPPSQVYTSKPTYRPTQTAYRQVKATKTVQHFPPQSHNFNTPKSQRSPFAQNSQSQSFNVGYSVKFTNNNERPKVHKAPRFEADIITGSRKEEVKKPSSYASQNLFVPAATNQIITSNSKPQEHVAYLETIHGYNQYQPQKDVKVQSVGNNQWSSVGPSVEIFKSREVKLGQHSTPFDHQRALGKSEGFDYSNAVDYGGYNRGANVKQVPQQQYAASQVIPLLNQGSFKFPESKPPPKFAMDTSLLRDPILTMHNQPLTIDSRQIPIRFDTSLIQEVGKGFAGLYDEINASSAPYIAQNFSQDTQASDQQVTYHSNLVADQTNTAPVAQALYQPPPSTVEETKDQIAVYMQSAKNFDTNDQNEMKFGFPQNALFNPSMLKMPNPHGKVIESYKAEDYNQQKHKMYMVNENVQETLQPKPVPLKVFSKPPNAYMRHEFDRFQKKRVEKHPRQPRINPKRNLRDFSIEMDLKPPPMPYKPRQRRTHANYEYRVY